MCENEKVIFEKERNFKEIFFDTFRFLKTEWKSYFLFIALYAGPFIAVSAYFNSLAQIKIQETQNLFSSGKLIYALLFDFVGEIMINGIGFGYILLYIKGEEITRDSIGTFFNQNLKTIFGASIFAYSLLFLGFAMFIIPGLILIGPLALYVFDKLQHKDRMETTITRCMLFSRSSYGLCYGVIFILYIAIFGLNQLLGYSINVTSPHFMIFNILLSAVSGILCSFTTISISLLYFSLFNKASK